MPSASVNAMRAVPAPAAPAAEEAVTSASRAGSPAPRTADGALPAMEVRGLRFAYGRNQVLRGVDLLVPEGRITTILGPNGCGKSTLFALMTKNLEPTAGKVFLRGCNIRDIALKDFARRVSIVHQNNTAAADMTVEQLVRLGRAPHQKPMSDLGEEDERLVEWALQVTGIAPLRLREVARLSGGQRQRVWIAMALAQNTRILFLDEPTTYLDIRYQLDILDLVRHLNREFGITVVMVLHDINQAIAYSDFLVGLKDGVVAMQGAPDSVVTAESMRALYGVDLEVTQVGGRTHVLLREGVGEAKCDLSAQSSSPAIRGEDDAGAASGLTREKDPAKPGSPVDGSAWAGVGGATRSSAATEMPCGRPSGRRPRQSALGVHFTKRGLSEHGTPDPSPGEGRGGGTTGAYVSEATRRAMETAAAGGEKVLPLAPNPHVSQATRAAMRAAGVEPGCPLPAEATVPAPANGGAPEDARPEPARSKSRVARALWAALGLACFGLGTVGVVLPILPTVPLYLAALFCFAKGSRRLHDWFVGTNLYHKHLEGFVQHRGMTLRTKLSIMGMVTLVMAIAFAMMSRVPVGRIILVAVWVFHVVYFTFFVKTDRPEGADGGEGDDTAGASRLAYEGEAR